MNILNFPQALKTVLDGEDIDFAVQSKHQYTRKKAFGTLLGGLFMTAFMSIFVAVMFMPLYRTGEVHFEANGRPAMATWDNMEALYLPGAIVALFAAIGLGILIRGILMFFEKGGYFVATPTRFLRFRKGNVKTTDWEQFNGNIELKGDDTKGTISFELRTGKMQSQKNGSRFVPDVIDIVGIENIYKIEQKCRQRIKENDPTPARNGEY